MKRIIKLVIIFNLILISKGFTENEVVKKFETKYTIQDNQPQYILKKDILEYPIDNLEFKNASIREVLRILGLRNNINIIPDKNVRGVISIYLTNVTLKEALDEIIENKVYLWERTGERVIRIRDADYVMTQIFPLGYASSSDIKELIQNFGIPINLFADTKTNSLVARGTVRNLKKVRNIINKVDKKPKQVVIEAKLIELYNTDSLDLGVNWNLASSNQVGNKTVTIGGAETGSPGAPSSSGLSSAEVSNHYNNNNNTYDGLTGKPIHMALGGTGVNNILPTRGGAFTIGAVMDSMMTNITLAALEKKGRTKTLSNPKIIAINNREARILVGDKVPYLKTTLSATGIATQSTEFIDIGIRLIVKPIITSDNRIILDVHPEVSTLRSILPEGPQVATREADTTVMVRNGETIVIGGLITDSDIKVAEKFPILGDLPILGHLFRHDTIHKENVELIIFLTPRIVE